MAIIKRNTLFCWPRREAKESQAAGAYFILFCAPIGRLRGRLNPQRFLGLTCFATESLATESLALGPVTVAVRVPDVLRGCHQYLVFGYRFVRFLSLSSSSASFPFSCSPSPSRPCSEDWIPCESGWLQVGSRAWLVVDALGRSFFRRLRVLPQSPWPLDQ